MSNPQTRLAYIVFRDHVQDEGLSYRVENPTPVVLEGYTNVIEETEDTIVVTQFKGRDEFCVFDRMSICMSDVIELSYGRVEFGAEEGKYGVEP